MLILADRGGEAIKKLLHGVGVYLGHDQSERIVRSRLNSREDISERESVGRLLHKLGLSRQKTRPSHPKKDPEAVKAFLKNARFA